MWWLLLLACGVAAHPWAMAPLPGDGRAWAATMPGLHGVVQMHADSTSVIVNTLNTSVLVRGHDRISGVAVVRDTMLGTGDLLVYVAAFDGDAVYRYQLDGRTGAVRGELAMLSPDSPRSVVLAADDRICVTGTHAPDVRVLQCYRIMRALDDADGATINEWWVMVSQFLWDAPTDGIAVDHVLFDSRAKSLEAARGGSLWIDDTHGSLVRFAVDSVSGMHLPDVMRAAYAPGVAHTVFTAEDTRDRHYFVEADRVRVLQWVDGEPRLEALPTPWKQMTPRDWLRAVVWRASSLSDEQRVYLSLTAGAAFALPLDRTAEAIASGEMAASPSATPQPSATATGTVPPSASATPSATPTPTVFIHIEEEVAEPHNGKRDLTGLWALVVLVLPCCALPVVLVLAWTNRRRIAPYLPRRGWLAIKPSGGLQPMDLHGVSGEPVATQSFYDMNTATSVAVPIGRNMSFQLGASPADNERLLR